GGRHGDSDGCGQAPRRLRATHQRTFRRPGQRKHGLFEQYQEDRVANADRSRSGAEKGEHLMFRVGLIILCFVAFTPWSFAQDERTTIKKSLIPAVGSDTRDFIPAGWKLEEQLSADLDGDGTSDYMLKLIENKPAKTSDDMMNDRARALIVLLQGAD